MNWIERFKALPVSSKRLLSVGVILAFVVALPLFIWAIVNQRFIFGPRAATGEATGEPPSPTAYTPFPTATPPSTVNSCGGSCIDNGSCVSGLICSSGVCRNPACISQSGCYCPTAIPTSSPIPGVTPPPTVRPFTINFKFEGVNDDSASYAKLATDAAKVTVKFLSSVFGYEQGYETPPVTVDYAGGGIYTLHFGIWSAYLPASNDYALILKGEKHIAIKFCRSAGQVAHCTGPGTIDLPINPITPVNLDFTGVPLQPGDLYPQDGAVTTLGSESDLSRLLVLLAKAPPTLTRQDLLTGDLDYNGVINTKDLFLLIQTLQTRYDEN